jgi:hypothetical protein
MDINQYYLNNNGNFVRTNQYGQYFQYYDYKNQPSPIPPPKFAPIHHTHQPQYFPTIIETIHYYDNRNYNMLVNNNQYMQPTLVYPAPQTQSPSGIPYVYHQPHHNYRNSYQQSQDIPLENLQLVSVSINYKQNPSKSSNESNDDTRFSSAQSSSSYSTYSSSSSNSSSIQDIINKKNVKPKEDEKEEESLITQSIQRHNIQQLNENFKKILCKPYNYYFNDSVFSHIHVKSGDSGNKNVEDNEDITLNNDNTIDNSDSMSQSSSDTSFSRYAPTDDDEMDSY